MPGGPKTLVNKSECFYAASVIWNLGWSCIGIKVLGLLLYPRNVCLARSRSSGRFHWPVLFPLFEAGKEEHGNWESKWVKIQLEFLRNKWDPELVSQWVQIWGSVLLVISSLLCEPWWSSELLSLQVQGYRMRLHFDGYPDCYDFWANADSSDIHPVGWCEKTSHKLLPPKGITENRECTRNYKFY